MDLLQRIDINIIEKNERLNIPLINSYSSNEVIKELWRGILLLGLMENRVYKYLIHKDDFPYDQYQGHQIHPHIFYIRPYKNKSNKKIIEIWDNEIGIQPSKKRGGYKDGCWNAQVLIDIESGQASTIINSKRIRGSNGFETISEHTEPAIVLLNIYANLLTSQLAIERPGAKSLLSSFLKFI